MGKFSGKIAVVTGASKGIGAGIAKRLASEGASVVVNYASSKEGAEQVVAEIVAAGGKAIAVQAQVNKKEDVVRLFSETRAEFGRVDVLVNSAGIYGFTPLASIGAPEFGRYFDVNVLGVLLATKAAFHLFPAEGGSVVNIGSVISRLAPPEASIYAGTKAAVEAITKSLAKELASRKIRVNSVSPGIVETEGTHSAGMIGTEWEAGLVAITPLGRVGQPGDIASAVSFLSSDEASWITGETLVVSGGAAM